MADLEARPLPGQDVVVIAPAGTKLGTKVTYNADHTRVRIKNTGTAPAPEPVPTPVPDPTPTFDAVLAAGSTTPDLLALLASGKRRIALRGGTHRIALGAGERHEAGVSLLPYPGESVVIDGTGLDPHFLYLGTGATWTLGAITLRGFLPLNSGIVAIGDGCDLHTLPGFTIRGPGVKGDYTSHGVYFHGTGTGTLDGIDIAGVPGAALQTYRGTPTVRVNGGSLGSIYVTVLAYSGSVAFAGTKFTSTVAAWDLQNGGASVTGLSSCVGSGANGTVRAYP